MDTIVYAGLTNEVDQKHHLQSDIWQELSLIFSNFVQ